MNKIYNCGKIASLVAFVLILGAGSHAYAKDFKGKLFNFEERQIYHSPETPGFTCWVGMWQMPNGPIQYEFTQRTSEGYSRPVFETMDVGQTWTRVPGDIPTGFCRKMAVLGSTGQTMVRPCWEYDGCVQRSMNGGQNWNGPIRFLPVDEYRSWPTVIKPLSDGRLVLYAGVYERDPENPNPDNNTHNANTVKTMFISEDQGQTWGEPITLVPKEVGTVEEGDFVELPNGDLVFMHRTRHYAPDAQSFTEDKMVSIATKSGDTFIPGPAWVPFSVPNPLPCNSPGFPCLLCTKEGVILDLSHIGSHYSNDQGRTWHDLKINGKQLATPYYPQAVQAEGMILVVGHRGGDDRYGAHDQAIIQQTFRVNSNLPEKSSSNSD